MPSPQFTSACITYWGNDFDPTNFPDFVSYVAGQRERAPATGNIHWQLYVEFSRRVTRPAIRRWLPGAHVERRNGTQQQAIDYCQKDDTYVDGRFTWGVPALNHPGHRTDLDNAIEALRAGGLRRVAEDCPREFVKFHRGLERLHQVLNPKPSDSQFRPRPWQQQLLDLVKEPANDRTIIWVYDKDGNKGKSRLAKHLVCEHQAILLSGKIVDMAYSYNKEPIVVFDLVRTQAEHITHLYGFSETLKNGMLHSTKYESQMKIFTPPHIIFFANTLPEDGVWTADRLKLIDLSDEA